MPKIKDRAYMDFSGGVRRDKSPYVLKDNELQRGQNFEVDDVGRIRKRRGCYQFGQNIAGLPLAMHHDPNGFFIANNASSPAVVYKLSSGQLADNITTATTSFDIRATGSPDFNGSADVVEIGGDLINYNSYSSATFSTVTNITSSHFIGDSVNQWRSVGTLTSSDADDGAWFAYLNGITFFLFNNGAAGGANYWQYNGSSASAVSNEPAGRFLEVFRDRVFMVGNGVNSTYPLNRVFYSNLGDGTSWPSTAADNSFDLEDVTGEPIVGIKQYRGNLMIFKPSSFYAYSGSLPVSQITSQYGIHNDACVQEINGLLYGFGPRGVWVSNGLSVQNIENPVVDYLQDFKFGYVANGSSVQSLFTAQWRDDFIVYIGDITTVETKSDVILVYNTLNKTWKVYSGWTDPTFMKYLNRFRADNVDQQRNVLFWGASTKVYRAFETRHTEIDTSGTATTRGTDIFADLFSNTGTNIQFEALTKPFDLKFPNYIKNFNSGYLRVFCENPQGVHVSIIIDDHQPIYLGQMKKKEERFKFPTKTPKGNRCAVLLNESSQVSSLIFNGVVFEDVTVISR